MHVYPEKLNLWKENQHNLLHAAIKESLNRFGRANWRGKIFQRKALHIKNEAGYRVPGNSLDYGQVFQRSDGKFWPQSGRT